MALFTRAALPLGFCVAFGCAFAESAVTAVFDQSNLPYSSEEGELPGLNVEIARLIAGAAGIDLRIRWVDSERDGLLSPLLAEEDPADLAVGVAVEPKTIEDEERVGSNVAYSLPFASARFVMVTRQDVQELPNFRAAGLEPVGVEAGSVASARLLEEGYAVYAIPSQERTLTALAREEISYAVLWNNAGWLIEHDSVWRERLKIHRAVPETYGFSWDLAVALRPEDTTLLDRLNEAIERLVEENAFIPVFKKYYVPYCGPGER